MSSSVVDESPVEDPQEVGHGSVDQEVVSEMVAFNAEEVTEVEGFEEWAGQQEDEEHEEDEVEDPSVGDHDMSHDEQQQQHHIIEGPVMLSTGGQVLLVDAEAVDGRVFTRSVSSNTSITQTTSNSSFCCTLCNTAFASKGAFVTHQRREHPNAASNSSATSPSIAPVSTAAAATAGGGTGATDAARRTHICSMCNKGFTTSSNLHQHRRLHFNERPFQCNQCNKGFATSTNLKQHYRTHTGDRPYPCMYCPKRFATNSNLRQHIRTHTAEIIAETAINAQVRNQSDGAETWEVEATPSVSLSLIPAICLQQYVCNICNKVYSNSSNLAQHKRTIHPKDFVRRYLCTFCNKTFSLITNLRRHQKRTCPNVKHEPGSEPPESWPCEECGKVCSTKGNLKSHKVTHLGIKLFECFICEKRFTTNSNLKQHLIVHDGKYNGHQTKRKRTANATVTSTTVPPSDRTTRLQSRTESSISTSNLQLPSTHSVGGTATTTVTNTNETNAAVRHLQEVESDSFVGDESNVGSADDEIVIITQTEQDHNETESAPTLDSGVLSSADVDGVGPVTLANEQSHMDDPDQQEQQAQPVEQQILVSSPGNGGRAVAVAATEGASTVTFSTTTSTPVTTAMTRLTKRPVIIKLDVDRDTTVAPPASNIVPSATTTSSSASACGVMIRAPPVRQPVLLPPPPQKVPPTGGGHSTALIGGNNLIKTGVTRRL